MPRGVKNEVSLAKLRENLEKKLEQAEKLNQEIEEMKNTIVKLEDETMIRMLRERGILPEKLETILSGQVRDEVREESAVW